MANPTNGSATVAANLADPFSSEPLAPTDMGHEGITGSISGEGGEHVAAPAALGLEAEGWVALAMLLLLALLVWRGIGKVIAKSLDGRIATIRAQLDDASRLRAEAEALKAEYEGRAASAAADADAVREGARREADAILAKAQGDAAQLIERRTAMAEAKIAAAERTALADVRRSAADAATAAAARLLSERLDAGADRPLIDRTISGLGRLN